MAIVLSRAGAPGATSPPRVKIDRLSLTGRALSNSESILRHVERLDGLAIEGVSSVGPVRLRTPCVLAPAASSGAAPRLIGQLSGAPGVRTVGLDDGTATLSLSFGVLAPEVSRISGDASPVGTGSWIVHWPLAEEQWETLVEGRPELVVLSNSRQLLAEGEPFVRALAELRGRLGGRPLVWAPRVALPHRIPWLWYAGVDIVDTTETAWRAAEGTYFDLAMGTSEPSAVEEERGCTCGGCRRQGPPDLLVHALSLFESERRDSLAALRSGRLRERVEARLSAEPLLSELLRYTDAILGGALEERQPVTGNGLRTYVLGESHRRPEIRRYVDRFHARYRPPASKNVLLLVPCSKTKPYRNSRSHRRFRSAYEDLDGRSSLHVVSVTSPLGVVPRELEDVPPARHYDIPVTGDWSAEEQDTVRRGVEHLLNTGSYRRGIVHLDRSEYAFLEDLFPGRLEVEWTVDGSRPTSPPSLARLRSAASAAVQGSSPRDVTIQEVGAVASIQFGTEAAERLLRPPVALHGRPWFWRVTDGQGRDLATWREERGLFQLTTGGAERMLGFGLLQVSVGDGVPLTGDLFAPGVSAADPAIRVGDAIGLVRGGTLLAVGEAALPGRLMESTGRGIAVRVRHRTRPTPT